MTSKTNSRKNAQKKDSRIDSALAKGYDATGNELTARQGDWRKSKYR
jgi:hypothetical protein